MPRTVGHMARGTSSFWPGEPLAIHTTSPSKTCLTQDLHRILLWIQVLPSLVRRVGGTGPQCSRHTTALAWRQHSWLPHVVRLSGSQHTQVLLWRPGKTLV